MDALGLPRDTDVFGNGFGAFVTLELACRHGARFGRLVVADALAAFPEAARAPFRAMAEGVARRFAATAALAVTGIAGPSGGTPEKPVGTVWLAATLDGRTEAAVRHFSGDREDVRQRSAQAVLDLLRSLL